MKNVFSVLLVSALVSGCANDGGGSGVPQDDVFQKNMIPADAASEQDVKDLMVKLKKQDKVLPESELIFKTVVDGVAAVPVYSSDEKYKASLQKLNNDGKSVLTLIKTKCQINEAIAKDNGKRIHDAKGGFVETINRTAAMSTSGSDCPFKISTTTAETGTHIAKKLTARDYEFDLSLTREQLFERIVISTALQQSSGLVSSRAGWRLKSAGLSTYDGSEIKTSLAFSGDGEFNISLVDGDYLRGPIKISSEYDSVKKAAKNLQILFDARTSKGAVRIVGIKKSAEEEQQIYVNGRLVENSYFGLPEFGN